VTNKCFHNHREAHQRHSVFSRVLRFFAWWFAFIGLYSSSSVCPFCGQQGCPVGAGAAGFLGGFFALLVQDWKGAFKFIRHILFKGKGKV